MHYESKDDAIDESPSIKLTGLREPYLLLQILIPGINFFMVLFGQVGLKSLTTFKSQEPLVKRHRLENIKI